MNAKMSIKDFCTPDGRRSYATVEIDGVIYEVHYWYAQAYMPVKDPNYIMDYSFMTKVNSPDYPNLSKWGVRFETTKDNLITVKRFNSYFGSKK